MSLRSAFPTRVGVNPSQSVSITVEASFPHAGGGEPRTYSLNTPVAKLSPRGWG